MAKEPESGFSYQGLMLDGYDEDNFSEAFTMRMPENLLDKFREFRVQCTGYRNFREATLGEVLQDASTVVEMHFNVWDRDTSTLFLDGLEIGQPDEDTYPQYIPNNALFTGDIEEMQQLVLPYIETYFKENPPSYPSIQPKGYPALKLNGQANIVASVQVEADANRLSSDGYWTRDNYVLLEERYTFRGCPDGQVMISHLSCYDEPVTGSILPPEAAAERLQELLDKKDAELLYGSGHKLAPVLPEQVKKRESMER